MNFPVILQLGPFWKGIIIDINAAAQEKGIDALILFIDRAKDPGK